MSTTILSVDLDDIDCYQQIHGLTEGRSSPQIDGRERSPSVALCRCLPRFLELFSELGVRATFFVIGHDLADDIQGKQEGAQWLIEALKAGHELGNHSWSHAYDLASWPTEKIESDIRRCDTLLRQLGAAPRGFRAPGYVHHLDMLKQVARLGYVYDSSRLPSPPYYAAKIAAIGYKRLFGHGSMSQIRGWQSFWGQSKPYFMTQAGLWEIPISVSRWTSVPMVGTFLLSGPRLLSSWLMRQAMTAEYVHIELHAIDLIDPAKDPIPAELLKKQPEFRSTLSQRRENLRKLLNARSEVSSIATALGQTGISRSHSIT